MHSTLTLVPSTPGNWVSTDELVRPGDILDRCTVAVVQDAVAHLEGVRVVSVTVNTSGEYRETLDDAQPENFDAITSNRVEQAVLETNLPDFCDVRLEQSVGGHVVKTTVWVPLAWNGRFFGLGGQGNRASAPWIYPDVVRIASLPRVLRNGFAGAETDAGNRDPRFADWGLDVETHELDWELIRNWAHRSTHDMTLVGKAVTTALHGNPPIYSYFQGTSGGWPSRDDGSAALSTGLRRSMGVGRRYQLDQGDTRDDVASRGDEGLRQPVASGKAPSIPRGHCGTVQHRFPARRFHI